MAEPSPVSPLAPKQPQQLAPVAGIRLATAAASIKYQGRPDVMLMQFAIGTSIAAVLTRSATRSAAVDWCRNVLQHGSCQAVLVNAGNANAFTGKAGIATCTACAETTAAVLECSPQQVMLASTGVIGEPLDPALITGHLESLARDLTEDGWQQAAAAIMTTDTFAKGASRQTLIGTTPVTLTGIAKGSGMIAPDMATMLAFVGTDAAIPQPLLQTMLAEATEKSFNAITVDSDTSTSDTLILAASGVAGNPQPLSAADPSLEQFRADLDALLLDLALQVVADGEGASKLVAITVKGATDTAAARRIGLAIGNSPLVKTAIAGEDANWGRIVMAVGKSGEQADRDRLKIAIGGITIAEHGQRCDDYDEAPLASYMKGDNIAITVDIGIGTGEATVWTCDLTHGYISINADYRS